MKDTGKKNSTLISSLAQQTGRYGSNHWFRLDLDLQQLHAPVEPMHGLKVFAEHITKLLNGDEDGPKVRAAERSMGRFVDSCPDQVYRVYDKEKKTLGQRRVAGATNEDDNLQKKIPKSSLPPAPFTLTGAEKTKADQRLKAVKVPIGFGVLPDTLFTRICGGIKSHTWLQLYTHGFLRFCLRGMLGDQQRATLFNVVSLLEELFKETMDIDNFSSVTTRWHQALSQMERDFPLSLQTYVFHVMHHLPQYIKVYGPPAGFWMFPFERFNHTLTEAVSNNRYPELSAIKKIEIQWLLSMLDSSGVIQPVTADHTKDTTTKYIYSGRHKPVVRPTTVEEQQNLMCLFGTTASTIVLYHHAKVGEHLYRDATIETETQREKACVVQYGMYVGRIKTFGMVKINNTNHEIACMDWLGYARRCQESRCCYVENTTTPPNLIIPVLELSPPLIHAIEDQQLWILNE